MNSLIPNATDFYALTPFILLTSASLLFLIFQFTFHFKDRWLLRVLTLVTIAVAIYFVYQAPKSPGLGLYFQKQIKISELTTWLNILYLLGAFFTILVSPAILRKHKINFPEIYPLILFATLGMMFMTSGTDLLVIFIGLEIMSLSLYILVGMARNTASALEASLKYFLLGAFSSGFMLMGIAFLFGGCGTTDMETALRPLAANGFEANYTMFGFALFLIGIFFKIALVPFHAWTPDVYEGALTTITGFMSSGPKAAAMALLMILFMQIPFGTNTAFWTLGLAIIAGISMTWGNLAALKQTNLKRILAYSSISHAGYVTAGIVAGANLEVLYYLYIYSIMILVGFAIIAYLEDETRIVTLDSISGLMAKKPWTSVGLTIIFLSLSGFPPLAGFWAKLFLFQKLAESEQTMNQVLLVVGVINSAIAFIYYVKIMIYTFMNQEEGEIARTPEITYSSALLVACSFGVVLVGVVWLIFQPSSFL